MKHCLVTGGAGFIGHNLALELARQGCHVEIVDSLHVNNLLSIAQQQWLMRKDRGTTPATA